MLFSFQRPQPSQAVPLKRLQSRKRPLRGEAPEHAGWRLVSVDSPSGSYPILQLPLGQRESVAVNFGFLKPLEAPNDRVLATPAARL